MAVRIELAVGRMTTTVVPRLISSGPVSFVVGAHGASVRASGGRPAYLIPDGQPPRSQAVPDYAGPAVPGPRMRQARHLRHSRVNRSNGARHELTDIGSDTVSAPIGVISPDGSIAALVDTSNENHDVHIRDLTSGADHRLSVPTDLGNGAERGINGLLADNRWLFIAAAQGHLAVVDGRTRQVRDLGTPLPIVSQLAIRSAPRD